MLTAHSLAVIRAGQHASGAYVASPTFSQYGYSWLRDGTWIAYAMDLAGDHASASAFYRWVGRALEGQAARIERLLASLERGETPAEQDYLPTRFTLAGCAEENSLWWDFQLDGYGTWLWGAVAHIEQTGDLALWAVLSGAVELTLRYLGALWQAPNYDCWEEHRQHIHPATLAAIYGGLRAVQRLEPARIPAGWPEAIRAYVLEKAIAPAGHVMKFLGNPVVDASLLWLACLMACWTSKTRPFSARWNASKPTCTALAAASIATRPTSTMAAASGCCWLPGWAGPMPNWGEQPKPTACCAGFGRGRG
ncbi:MAG: hypothetical protein HC915_15055 [Anaerolineae bacterium]|nr:hypothetical protein [Anaerolineae bacterium]